MSENPFAPPTPPPGGSGYPGGPQHSPYAGAPGPQGQFDYAGFQGYPPPRRRGWPTWLVVVVGVVSGIALAGAVTVGIGAIATAGDSSSSSSTATGPDGTGTPSDPAPSASPKSSGPDDGTAEIDFPDGSTGKFAVPDGLSRDTADDDDGHVALSADDDSAAYLDVYTDETTASQKRDLHLVATQDASDDRNHGNKTGAISYGTVGGHQAAQYRFSHHDDNGTFDGLVTVVLVGNEQISFYWSDDADDFSAADGQRMTAALLKSLKVSGGQPGSDT